MVPLILNQLGNEHGNVSVRICCLLRHGVIHDGLDDEAIGRVEDHELRDRQVRLARWLFYHLGPLAAQIVGAISARNVQHVDLT